MTKTLDRLEEVMQKLSALVAILDKEERRLLRGIIDAWEGYIAEGMPKDEILSHVLQIALESKLKVEGDDK